MSGPKAGLHLKTTVEMGVGWTAQVSTIDLALSGFGTGIETCVFFEREGAERISEVVAAYTRPEEAEKTHAAFCAVEVLWYVLKSAQTAKMLREQGG